MTLCRLVPVQGRRAVHRSVDSQRASQISRHFLAERALPDRPAAAVRPVPFKRVLSPWKGVPLVSSGFPVGFAREDKHFFCIQRDAHLWRLDAPRVLHRGANCSLQFQNFCAARRFQLATDAIENWQLTQLQLCKICTLSEALCIPAHLKTQSADRLLCVGWPVVTWFLLLLCRVCSCDSVAESFSLHWPTARRPPTLRSARPRFSRHFPSLVFKGRKGGGLCFLAPYGFLWDFLPALTESPKLLQFRALIHLIGASDLARARSAGAGHGQPGISW